MSKPFSVLREQLAERKALAGKTRTEREYVLAQRKAYALGVEEANIFGTKLNAARHLAESYYPLPKVARQRVITRDSKSGCVISFAIVDGRLRYEYCKKPQDKSLPLCDFETDAERALPIVSDISHVLSAYAELVQNPTEWVEDDA